MDEKDISDWKILNKYDNIEDYKVEDFLIKDYNYHEQIKLIMSE